MILDDIHRAINTAERQLVVADFERAAEAIALMQQARQFRRRRRFDDDCRRGQASLLPARHRGDRIIPTRQLMRMVAATLEKKDVVLAISTTGKPKELIDAVTIAREYGATVIAITKPNSPLAMLADISLGLYVPETPNALKPTASRFALSRGARSAGRD